MIRLKMAGILVTSSLLAGIPFAVVFALVFLIAILDVLVVFLQTDIVQTFIREREKTKRLQLSKPKKDKKNNHKR